MQKMAAAVLQPRQPGFVKVTDDYEKYTYMKNGIAHFYQFVAKAQCMNAVPDASVDIIFEVNENSVESRIAGTVKELCPVELKAGSRYFGVRFMPGFNPVHQFVKMQELVENELHFEDMEAVGLAGSSLYQELLEAKDFFTCIEAFLRYYYREYDFSVEERFDLKNVVRDEIIKSRGNIRLYDLEEITGYSSRYLNKVIHNEFGLSPKELIRFIRFQNAMESMILKQGEMESSSLALEAGYYDQPHFIKEFKSFTTYTPQQYIEGLKKCRYMDRLHENADSVQIFTR